MSLNQAIKAEAHRLGFDLVGITTPEPLVHFSVYERWINLGLHGQMNYLATDRALNRRADPRAIFPDCRSILVLGARYPSGITGIEAQGGFTADERIAGEEPNGKVAGYACGLDYHDLFPSRLRALTAFLEAKVGHSFSHRWYTDTGPLLERDLAQRAGLGWIGKNTCLISPALGSFFLLAEILVGLDLEPDPPFLADRCGTCTSCISACPTGCILPDRTIDAGRCISYLTIELKGPIPLDLRPKMGGWVFGCDICQQVCPWNREVLSSHIGCQTNLLADMKLTPEAFNQIYKNTPLSRAKRRGYLRNVAVALGNSHNTDAIPILVYSLRNDPEPLVRGHAAWALGQMGSDSVMDVLWISIRGEMDTYVRAEIQTAINSMTV